MRYFLAIRLKEELMTPAQKAALTRKRRQAGKKAALTRKRRAAARKNEAPIAGAVLINANGTYAFQVPQVQSGARYYLQVSASPFAADQVGNYDLLAHFGQVQADLPTLVSG